MVTIERDIEPIEREIYNANKSESKIFTINFFRKEGKIDAAKVWLKEPSMEGFFSVANGQWFYNAMSTPDARIRIPQDFIGNILEALKNEFSKI